MRLETGRIRENLTVRTVREEEFTREEEEDESIWREK